MPTTLHAPRGPPALGLKALGDRDCREGPGQGITRTGTVRETDLHWYLMLHTAGREQHATWFSIGIFDYTVKIIYSMFSSL
jgi:hypothetical protein